MANAALANKDLDKIRKECENSLKSFAKWVMPDHYFGEVHDDLFDFFQYGDARCKLGLIPRDHLKVLAYDEPVLLSDGTWKITGELEVGDSLADPSTGEEQEVTHLHPWGEDDYYEITFDDGRKVKCGAGHLWEVEQQGFKEDNPIVRDTLWLLEHYKRDRLEPRTGNYFVEYKSAVVAPEPLQFKEQDLPMHPYVVGAWLGDGTTSAGALTSEDSEIPEYVAEHGYVLKKYKSKYGYGLGGLCPDLKKNNLHNNKHIPDIYLKASIEQRMELLRGLLDTDGNINKMNGIASFTQCDKRKHLNDGVEYLVRSLGGKAKTCEVWSKVSKESTQMFKSHTTNIWLPKSVGVPFKMKRKVKLYNEVARFKPQMLKTWIKDISPIPRRVSRCITVSNPRGLYITNGFITTHNSTIAAITVAWHLTTKPWWKVNYVSYSESLVIAQMTAIENIFKSEAYRELWFEHINFERDPRKNMMVHKPTEGWNKQNFFLDHPSRKERMVRDPSVRATTAKSGNTGMHSDLTVFDDLVTDENWDTAAGKADVLKCYKSFAKINSTGGRFIAVGTRYSEDDLYSKMTDIEYKVKGKTYKRWDKFERVVEDSYRRTGDGTFIWAKQKMPNGEWYGFDEEELAIKKADALIDGDIGLFFGQYYNDPSDESTHIIKNSNFKYIDLKHLEQQGTDWHYKDKRLKLFAAADLAWTDSTSKDAKRRDHTALAVVGIDEEGYIYVLALERFQTDKPEKYYEKIIDLYNYWGFKKLTVETNSAGKFIKNFLSDEVRRNGGRLEIEGKTHTSHSGKKEERVAQTLHHRYRNGTIYHTKGGYTKLLEEELKLLKPPHDDLKDVLSIAVAECVAPLKRKGNMKKHNNVVNLSRFGGMRRSRRS